LTEEAAAHAEQAFKRNHSMNNSRAVISSKAVERIRAGHLWIYRSDVLECNGDPGSLVSLYDKKERFYGKAFYSSASLISLRLVTGEDEPVDRAFWLNRLEQAWELRKRVVADTEVFRLLNGEGDGMPSIIVDRYGEVLVIQTLSQGAEQVRPILVDVLLQLFSPRSIVERNDSKTRELEGLTQQVSVLHGPDPGEIVCIENGLQFSHRPTSGQKTGGFLDQRENRAWAQKLAFGKGLDCFCYSGAFAVHIARACQEVEAIDKSETALQAAQRNVELNQIGNIHLEADNVFDRLRLYNNLKRRFDTIILDPPAFAKSRSQIQSALRGYKEINLRALRLLNPGGLLITASCSQVIDETTFLNVLTDSAADANRKVQVIQKRTQAQDHPFLLAMPETYYLKCLFLRVLD
jgi:23S rRNA (cytosine1962-C5)-methyltransferase